MSKMRVGLDGNRPPVLDMVRALGANVLISANNLWDPRRGKFRQSLDFLDGLDVALDSGGFVAMKQYGRFLFSVRQYLALVARLDPTWWASMDFCCEEDCPIGGTTTWERQVATMQLFGTLWRLAPSYGVRPPTPVLQGWRPSDYWRSFGMLHAAVHWRLWPALIGIGSVCRRQIDGPDGILVPGSKWLSHSLFATLCYAFGRVNPELSQVLMTGLKSGFELGRPFNMLRERLLTNAGSKAKLDLVYIAAIAIKTWNAEVAGKSMSNLRWSNPPEKFPKIEGLKLK